MTFFPYNEKSPLDCGDFFCGVPLVYNNNKMECVIRGHSLFMSLPDLIRQSRSTGQSPWMTRKGSVITSGDDRGKK